MSATPFSRPVVALVTVAGAVLLAVGVTGVVIADDPGEVMIGVVNVLIAVVGVVAVRQRGRDRTGR